MAIIDKSRKKAAGRLRKVQTEQACQVLLPCKVSVKPVAYYYPWQYYLLSEGYRLIIFPF